VPFEADTYMGVLTQHMFVKPIPPSSVSGHAGSLGALEDVTLKALEKEPEARFRSMEELAAEIRRVVRIGPGGEALVDPPRARVLSPPPSFAPTDPASDPGHVPREGVPLWVFAASGALILGAGGTAAWIAWRSPPSEPPPSPAVVVSAPPPPLLTVPPPPPSMSLAASAPAASTADPPPRRVKPPPARRPPQSARPGGMDSDFVDPWKK
jgi:serine/threonine-protein kinase